MEAGIAAVGEAGIAAEVAEVAEVIRRVAAAAVVDIPPAVVVAVAILAVGEVAVTVEVLVGGGNGKKPHPSAALRAGFLPKYARNGAPTGCTQVAVNVVKVRGEMGRAKRHALSHAPEMPMWSSRNRRIQGWA
jgi:hypothetical protein